MPMMSLCWQKSQRRQAEQIHHDAIIVGEPMDLTTAHIERTPDDQAEMEAAVRAFDWGQTPIGERANWPQSLRTAVSICLASNFPMIVFWGPQFVQIYNDAYIPILGAKHPQALGQTAQTCCAEIWEAIYPLFHTVHETGKAVFVGDRPFFIERFGFVEEAFFTFSYGPIQDESGMVGGILEPVTETTARMLSERRMQVLRDLAARVATLHGEAVTIQGIMDTLRTDLFDIPVALLYLLDTSGQRAQLQGTMGLGAARMVAPQQIDLAAQEPIPRILAEAIETREPVLITDVHLLGDLPGGPWPEPTRQAIALPLATSGQAHPLGVLITGISPRLQLDPPYHDFLRLIAGQVATAITSTRAYTEEKQRAEAFMALDQAKTTFFSNISHEFRTPLTLLLGPVADSLADKEEPLLPQQRARQELVQRNAVRLLKLVNNLLDYARLEAGRMQAEFQPLDLAKLTCDLASHFHSAMEQAGLEYVIDCPRLTEPVYVDPGLWEQLVLNLISNALKYTMQGSICVALYERGDQVVFEVRDTGVGIPAASLPHLFERFYRAPGATGRTHEGTGIGLALVQELVKLHGGTITVESSVGQGSTFSVTIPHGTAHLPTTQIRQVAQPMAALTSAQVEYKATERWVYNTTDESGNVSRPGAPHILLVEDNPDMRDYLLHLLQPHYQVTLAINGIVALEHARAQSPDMVLSDVMMPGMDGFSLLRSLRADPQTCAIPVVLLSARAGEEATVEGIEAGADDYLVKPFSARELLTRVATHLELAHLRRKEAALREANRRMNDFVGIAGHELRTPLTTMLGNVQLAERQIQQMGQNPRFQDVHLQLDRVKTMLRHAIQSARRLTRLVSDMLDMALIDGEHLPLNMRLADVVALVREIVAEHQQAWPGRTITLQEPQQPAILVNMDRDRIAQVIANYLSNALKYAPIEAPITVSIQTQSGQIYIAVQDQGPGLPPDEQQKIWERFHRVEGVIERQGSGVGLGLGLYLSKMLITQHGGEVGVKSLVGLGSTFWFTLPLAQPVVSERQEAPIAPSS